MTATSHNCPVRTPKPSEPDTLHNAISPKVSICHNLWILIRKIIIHSIAGIGVVAFWQGSWCVMDHFYAMDTASEKVVAALISIAISAAIPLLIGIAAFCVPKRWLKMKSTTTCTMDCFMRKIIHYVLIFLFGCTNAAFWRGIWYLLDVLQDDLFPDNLLISGITAMTGGLLLLVLIRRFSAIGSVPMVAPTLDSDRAAYLDEMRSPAVALKSLFLEDSRSHMISVGGGREYID